MRPLLFAMIVLAVFGMGVAGYLTYAHFDEAALVCAIGGCETVQESDYSTIGPLPIAALGLGMFMGLTLAAAYRLTSPGRAHREKVSILVWALLLTGILYYLYLTYVELFVLNAVCQWCVISSIIALAIFAIESVYLWRTVMDADSYSAG